MIPAAGPPRPDLESAVLALEPDDVDGFDDLLGEIVGYQRTHNPIVSAFDEAGGFVPVAAFREGRVACFSPEEEEGCFLSSGTGSGRRARHPVRSFAWFDRVCAAAFDRAFGTSPVEIAGHLPQYAGESSLVRMVRRLAERRGSGTVPVHTFDATGLAAVAARAASERRPLLLIGAAFGLLDLLDQGPIVLPGNVRIVETGGMKTYRREMAREDLHERLAVGFGVPVDHVGSEYGMCELTSQAWAPAGAWYEPPPWMRVRIVDPEDPDRPVPDGRHGRVAVEDLANLYSASRVLTEDLGVARGRRFTVSGRIPGSPIRGCNLLFEP